MRRLLVPHLALWIVGGALIRVAIVPPEVCPAAAATEARQAASNAGDWLARGVGVDGRYTYGYRASLDEIPREYSAVRHAAASLSLYLLVEAGEPRFLEAGDTGLRYMLDNLVETSDWTAYSEPSGDVSLGANGLLVASLAARRRATGDNSYDDLMRGAGAFLEGQQQTDGSMLAYWRPAAGAPVPDTYGIFATGEAFWGLTLLNSTFPLEGWGDAALAVGRYLATDRDREEGQVTRYPDHWAAYGMAELVEVDDTLADYAKALAGFFSVRLRVESQRTGKGINVAVRGWPGPPSGVATAAEGMAALHRLADTDARLADMQPGMIDDLECYVGMTVRDQVDATKAASYPSPELAEGAWFYRDYSQIDDQQHHIAALLAVATLLEEGP